MTRSELTRSELLKDAATVALGTAIAAICNKNGWKVLGGTILTAAVTIVTVDIVAVTKNRSK